MPKTAESAHCGGDANELFTTNSLPLVARLNFVASQWFNWAGGPKQVLEHKTNMLVYYTRELVRLCLLNQQRPHHDVEGASTSTSIILNVF